MAISNELSSDIAAALLVENKSPQELRRLKDVILKVHSALQKMSAEERSNRLKESLKSVRTVTERGSS
jgi:hypothetical protein